MLAVKLFTSIMLLFSASLVKANPFRLSSDLNYEVLFTNPICEAYEYKNPLETESGNLVYSKPANVFCKRSDSEASVARESSPHNRLVHWIEDKDTKEIFFAYLSFSNEDIYGKLCAAVAERGVKVSFVLDSGAAGDSSKLKRAEQLKKCETPEGDHPVYYLRGGKKGLGYAHNKIFVINPSSENKIKIAFGSGNLSSGTSLHHENWHFISGSAGSYFAKSHICLIKGMIDSGDSKKSFEKFMSACRENIDVDPESSIQAFFVPGQGDEAMSLIENQIAKSSKIYMAAHRFSANRLIMALTKKLKEAGDPEVRLVADDDLYWAGKLRKTFNSNTTLEHRRMKSLENLGMESRFLQTNHWGKFLHHNKYLIFFDKNGEPTGVFTGAGNLTNAAFTKNYENFYFITNKKAVSIFVKQYEHVWADLATARKDMPVKDVKPK